MEDYWEDEETEEEDFPEEPYEDDEEILKRHSKLKFIRRILAIVAILFFVGVFVAPELARHLPFLTAGPQTPDYVSLVDEFSDFALFDPGVVHYSITYETQFNHELLESTIRTAAADWEETLDGFFDFTWVEDGEAIDLVFIAVDDLPPTKPGHANFVFDGEHYRPWVVLDVTQLVDPRALHMVVAHEMGHALGIWGHSDYPGDLMYPFPERARPSKRDARTLKLIYGIE